MNIRLTEDVLLHVEGDLLVVTGKRSGREARLWIPPAGLEFGEHTFFAEADSFEPPTEWQPGE